MGNKKFDFLNKIPKDKLLIGLLTGILLIVIAIPTKSESDNSKDNKTGDSYSENEDSATDNSDYEENIEKKLENILGKIEGAGKVKVMVTLKDYGETIVKKDETVSYFDSDLSSKNPYTMKKIEPSVEGILVVAEGGNNSVTVQNILNAILALFDLEPHKINVVKMIGTEGNKWKNYLKEIR